MRHSILSAGLFVRHMLAESPEVAAITDNVFPVVKREGLLPYIGYARVGMDAVQTRNGSSKEVDVQVVCYGADYESSLSLAEAVCAAMDGKSATLEGMAMRSCFLADAAEGFDGDAYTQTLIFKLKI